MVYATTVWPESCKGGQVGEQRLIYVPPPSSSFLDGSKAGGLGEASVRRRAGYRETVTNLPGLQKGTRTKPHHNHSVARTNKAARVLGFVSSQPKCKAAFVSNARSIMTALVVLRTHTSRKKGNA